MDGARPAGRRVPAGAEGRAFADSRASQTAGLPRVLARLSRLLRRVASHPQGPVRRRARVQPPRGRHGIADRAGRSGPPRPRLRVRAQRRQGLRGEAWLLDQARGVGKAAAPGRRELVLCGDMNITRTDLDVHPNERKPGIIGQREEERELFDKLLAQHLVDVGRALDPDNPNLFTWWAPWRNLRQRNIGWRLDYILASPTIAERAASCAVLADVGTSDHAPVVMTTA